MRGLCVFFFSGSDDKISCQDAVDAGVATVPHCSVASVHKRLQASGVERGRNSVQEYMKAEHWPAKQVICVEILVFLCLNSQI